MRFNHLILFNLIMSILEIKKLGPGRLDNLSKLKKQ